ncbi:MAG: hypothetical protein COZ18_08405 [Flexibacter sp. CG_4_10_14_3_um_filter_32_15]|nr:MAG: hypothetical protein COZ18_08405 [Flexibacter sp. CG_4_10_14_3_um_filter_32_15]
MYVSNLNQRELELAIKGINNTVDELRNMHNKLSILNLDHNKNRRNGTNQITNVLREYEDLVAKLEKELK